MVERNSADFSRRGVLAGGVGSAWAGASLAQPADVANIGQPAGAIQRPIDEIHVISSEQVISHDLIMTPRGGFQIARGATLRLMGDLVAPAAQIFFGPGTVDLTHSRLLFARPEWWGGFAGRPEIDCRASLSACIASHPAMQLGLGDYHLGGTWTIDQPNRRVWGVGRTKGGKGTRLLLTAGAGPVVLVGTEDPPNEINLYPRGIDRRWLELGRSSAAPPPKSGDPASVATGLAVRHVLDSVFEGLRANEHAVGFSLRGAVRTFVRDCAAFRSLAPDPGGRDIFVGFDLDGRDPPIATGANASLYLIDCVASTGNHPRLSISTGCRLAGAFSDTFIIRLETTALGRGIDVVGDKRGGPPRPGRARNLDLHIELPVLDQCLECGISIEDLDDDAMIDVVTPYVGLGPNAISAISIRNSGGAVSVLGGQLVGTPAPGAAGIVMEDVSGVAFNGTKLLDFSEPVKANRLAFCELILLVNRAHGSGAGAAISLNGASHCYLRPRLMGSAKAYRTAVDIDGSSHGVVVELAGVDRRVLTDAGAVMLENRAWSTADAGRVDVRGAFD